MQLLKIDHVGIRVMQFDRSITFYKQLGFMVTRNDVAEHIVVIKHPNGIELNLLDSGTDDNKTKNILMDIDVQYPGYTHFAIAVSSVEKIKNTMDSLGISITEGPIKFGDGKISIFIRDPDKNVLEFTELPRK